MPELVRAPNQALNTAYSRPHRVRSKFVAAACLLTAKEDHR